MKSRFTLFLLAAVITWQGCDSDDDDIAKGEYQNGIFVINEGGFGNNNGSVTYYDAASGAPVQNVFKRSGGFAGDVLQSMTVAGDTGYLVLNGSNRIEIVNHNTLASISTFTTPALDKPRYVEVIGNKAFISVWGAYNENFELIDSYILVVDVKKLEVTDTIDTPEGVENLLYDGRYLFAAINNFNDADTIAVIDPRNHSLVSKIPVPDGPAAMVLDANKDIWVVATGTYSSDNDGKLIKIDGTTHAVKAFDLEVDAGADIVTTPDGRNVIYSGGSAIYKMPIDASTAPQTPWIDASDVINIYALGIDKKTQEVYVGDALRYDTEGVVYVYTPEGGLKTSFAAGISPTQFVFK